MVREVQVWACMALREFESADGKQWRVWDTIPGRSEGLSSDFREGWLTVDNGTERRRLAPLPAAWTSMDPKRLELLLRVAQSVGSGGDQTLGGYHVDRRVGERRRGDRRVGDRRRRASDGDPATGPHPS